MASKYEIFCRAVELHSFTEAAHILNYSQSAVSQAIKSLEQELGATLITRKRDGVKLTADGEQLYPYLQGVYEAEQALQQKRYEMDRLQGGVVRIGTFPAVSRKALPALMKQFKEHYPAVRFILYQGEYTEIEAMLKSGKVEIGFSHAGYRGEFECAPLFEDPLLAVLPADHPLAGQREITLEEFSAEPFIILDEGKHSVIKDAFAAVSLAPRLESRVYDDSTIVAMVEQGLGVSLLYRSYLQDYHGSAVVLPVRGRPVRNVALIWRQWGGLSYATRKFVEFLRDHLTEP